MSVDTNNVISNRSFKSIFQSQARYEIPFFQRGYAWDKPQWDKLLEDVNEEILKEVEDGDYDDQEHFFGPVVVLEKTGGHHSLKRFLIIDGQQRITTVYLILGTIVKLMEEKQSLSPQAFDYITQLQTLLYNNVEDSDEYLRLKVYSTKGDRYPTFLTLFGRNPRSPKLQEDMQLYVPGQNKVDQLGKYLRKNLRHHSVPQLWQLAQALIRSLKIVWIPLDGAKDDAQAIFESLNAAGLPLSASELLCNFLFRPLTNDQTNEHEKLHNDKWLTAQHAITEEGGNFEDYLRNLFSIGATKMVGHDRRLYVYFKTKNRALTREIALSRLEEIHDNTKYYNQAFKPAKFLTSNPEIAGLLVRINETNMTTARPFIMALLRAMDMGTLSEPDVRALIRETYVLLVRRKLTGLPTTKYDVIFPVLINRIANEPSKVRAFQKVIIEENVYVSDQELEDALVQRELYKNRELGFSRLILKEIDRVMQPHGELPDYTTISTIEHIMPQTLDESWKSELGEEANNPDINRIKNTLGNLCLNSGSANSAFGQLSFEKKQEKYNGHQSALNRDVTTRTGTWNSGAIKKRSYDLAQYGLKIWKWATVENFQ